MQKSLANGLRSIVASAASIASRTAQDAAAPQIELSTTDLKERNNNNNSNNSNSSAAHAPSQRLSAPPPTESSSVVAGSSPATLGRLFQKRSHKSTTDVVAGEDKRCDSNR